MCGGGELAKFSHTVMQTHNSFKCTLLLCFHSQTLEAPKLANSSYAFLKMYTFALFFRGRECISRSKAVMRMCEV